MAHSVGVVLLTQGTRPDDLARGLASLRAQQGVELDIVVVGNGYAPTVDGVKSLALDENVGIPAGRNRGVPLVSGEYIFFLDDDASLPSPTFLSDAISKIVDDPSIGLIQPRVADAASAENPRRWIPRIRKGDPQRSSNVFSAWEGAVLLPRGAFDATGGWGDPYFYAHEGIELAWRVWDLGLRVWYAGDLLAHHPAIKPTRHDYYYRLTARNRVWLAKRNLPWVLAPIYVGTWTGVQLLRFARDREGARAWWAGWREGWATPVEGRRGIKWVTVWRMARYGRAPLI